MKRYKVVIVGMGPRGIVHGQGFLGNPERFDLAAVCDLDPERLAEGARTLGVGTTYTDAQAMLAEVKPDVFCFATLPHIRMPLIELAVAHGVKAIAFEKPMATTLQEAAWIVELCERHGVKTVVGHQMRYIESMRRLKAIIDAGDIGEVKELHAQTLPWLAQLGTHFINYMLWVNGDHRAQWVVGHVHGKEKLTDTHPSPDYAIGRMLFDNGVRGTLECGYLCPPLVDGKFWVSNRLTVYGTHGYAFAETDGRFGAFFRSTGGELIDMQCVPWGEQRLGIQVAYLKELADWLDDDRQVHSCKVQTAYHGQEILDGICLSALTNTRVDFPLDPLSFGSIIETMKAELPS